MFYFTLAAGALGVAFMQFLADRLAKGDRKGAARSFANAIKLLGKMNGSDTFEDGDGISAAQLMALAQTHMEIIERK